MTDEQKAVTNHNEAGGVAYTTLYSKTGATINLTARGNDPKDALKSLVEAIIWAMGEYEMTPTRQTESAPAPSNAPVTQQEAQQTMQTQEPHYEPVVGSQRTIKAVVDHVEVAFDSKGQKCLKVYGGDFKKYPVTCWGETAEKFFDLSKMEAGTQYKAPEGKPNVNVMQVFRGSKKDPNTAPKWYSEKVIEFVA